MAEAPGSSPADEEAAALFARVDLRTGELDSLALSFRTTTDVTAYIERWIASANAAQTSAGQLVDRFEPVIDLGSPRWSVSAYVRQAQVYEALASRIAGVLERMPPFVLRYERGRALPVTAETQAELRRRLGEAARPLLDPIECLAILHYLCATRASEHAHIESLEATQAATRLSTFPPERVAGCAQQLEAAPRCAATFERAASGAACTQRPAT